MSSLRDRFYTGMGVAGMGTMLVAALGGAVADRLLHPVDTCRGIRKHRASQ
jgi:hypothetical protein